VRCCVWAQLLSRLLFIFFFCLLCEVERPSASQSRQSIPARADGRSHKEPTVDPTKSRRSIPARADGRSQQMHSFLHFLQDEGQLLFTGHESSFNSVSAMAYSKGLLGFIFTAQ
jgi:hypothetical protein